MALLSAKDCHSQKSHMKHLDPHHRHGSHLKVIYADGLYNVVLFSLEQRAKKQFLQLSRRINALLLRHFIGRYTWRCIRPQPAMPKHVCPSDLVGLWYGRVILSTNYIK